MIGKLTYLYVLLMSSSYVCRFESLVGEPYQAHSYEHHSNNIPWGCIYNAPLYGKHSVGFRISCRGTIPSTFIAAQTHHTPHTHHTNHTPHTPHTQHTTHTTHTQHTPYAPRVLLCVFVVAVFACVCGEWGGCVLVGFWAASACSANAILTR